MRLGVKRSDSNSSSCFWASPPPYSSCRRWRYTASASVNASSKSRQTSKVRPMASRACSRHAEGPRPAMGTNTNVRCRQPKRTSSKELTVRDRCRSPTKTIFFRPPAGSRTPRRCRVATSIKDWVGCSEGPLPAFTTTGGWGSAAEERTNSSKASWSGWRRMTNSESSAMVRSPSSRDSPFSKEVVLMSRKSAVWYPRAPAAWANDKYVRVDGC